MKKAKSINPLDDDFLTAKDDYIDKGWLPYLSDVAFQTWVMEKALPQYAVTAYLMLADKTKTATVDGLNQHFFLKKHNDRTTVEIHGNVAPDALGQQILSRIPVRHLVDKIRQGSDLPERKKNFEQNAKF